jgi:hypothetical protein
MAQAGDKTENLDQAIDRVYELSQKLDTMKILTVLSPFQDHQLHETPGVFRTQ